MEGLVYFLAIFSLFGSSCSVSNRAFRRDLNRKFDILKASVQQEVGGLKFEVLDLRSQLKLERARTNQLEELLNSTGIDTNTHEDVDRREDIDLTSLTENVEKLKKKSQDLEHGQKSLRKYVTDVVKNVRESHESKANADVFALMKKAFNSEKKRARKLESTVEQKMKNSSKTTARLRSDFDNVDAQVKKNVRDIGDIRDEQNHLRFEANGSNDVVGNLQLAVENVTDDTLKSSREIEDIQNDLNQIQGEADVSKDAVAELQHELQLMLVETKNTSEHLNQALNTVAEQGKALNTVTEQVSDLVSNDEDRVSFHAVIDKSSNVVYDKGETLVFPWVDNNIGGGYQKDTGIFIAPKAGIYMFSASITSSKKDENKVLASIVHNGHHLVSMWAQGDATHHDQSSATAIRYLDAGDKVWVRIFKYDDVSIWGGNLSSFVGCLIVPY